MKPDKVRYEKLRLEYRGVYAEYERLVAEMLALAADPESELDAYRSASQRAAELFEQLAALRREMRETYGRTGTIATEQERPPYPEV